MIRKLLFTFLFLAPLISFSQDSSLNSPDEFEEFTNDSAVINLSSPTLSSQHKKSSSTDLYWTLSVLGFTVLAGVFVRYKSTRQLRSLFLILSIAILGFYRAGCPCSIQSFQNGILLLTGNFIRWPSLILFPGLLIVTYFFGRVYCGWICHLGALQELIFKTSTFRLFQSERSQKIMRGIRITALVTLISQLLITHTNLYKQIDPFAVIFNFYSNNFIGWMLVAIVAASSFFLYRPFCKTLCPVGLALGWVNKIPGSSVLGVKPNCTPCQLCNRSCSINAITHDSKISKLDNQECIRCGECLISCKKDAITFFKKNKQHRSVIECKPSCLSIT